MSEGEKNGPCRETHRADVQKHFLIAEIVGVKRGQNLLRIYQFTIRMIFIVIYVGRFSLYDLLPSYIPHHLKNRQ